MSDALQRKVNINSVLKNRSRDDEAPILSRAFRCSYNNVFKIVPTVAWDKGLFETVLFKKIQKLHLSNYESSHDSGRVIKTGLCVVEIRLGGLDMQAQVSSTLIQSLQSI